MQTENGVIDPSQLNLPNGFKFAGFHRDYKVSNLDYAIFENDIRKITVMNMVGTQMDNGIFKGDWGDDVRQGLGLHVKQYDDAIKFALIEQASAQSKGFSFVLNGHSLGGGLATAAAAVTGAPAVIYNAAGLHPLSLIHAGYGSAIPNTGRNVVSYSVGFEALTTGQHLLSAIAPTAGASNYYMYAPDVKSWKDFNPVELHRPDATLRSIN